MERVSTEGCSDLDDFKESIKAKFLNLLQEYDCSDIIIFAPGKTTEIDPGEDIYKLDDFKISSTAPLVVKIVDFEVKAAENPAASITTYQRRKACVSCRSYLTSIALELDEIYPIVKEKSITGSDKPVTFGTIVKNASAHNPDPFSQFKDKFQKLQAHFTIDEWNYLENLNETVDGHLHLPLNPGQDVKHLILPKEFYGDDRIAQEIAKKANVVSDVSHLVVKNEGGF